MNGRVVIDTNIIIDFLSGREGFDRLGERLGSSERCVSVITRMELLSYSRLTSDAEFRIQEFLNDMVVIPLNDKVEKAAISMRRSAGLKLPDAIVAATSIVADAILITSDQRLANLQWPNFRAGGLF